jgi:hypothetical protein
MNTVVKKFALFALCTTALTAVSQTSQASVVFDISGGGVLPFLYAGGPTNQSADNVINDTTWTVAQKAAWGTGSTVYDPSSTADWKASTASINAILSVSGLAANQKYSVDFIYAGSEAGNPTVFSVGPKGNILTNGVTSLSTGAAPYHLLNSNFFGHPQNGPTVDMGSVGYINTGAGGNIPGFTVTDPVGVAPKSVTNGGTNAVPHGGKASLIFSYATFGGVNYTLTTTPTDFVVFGFNDSGSIDDNHDDFVGIAILTPGGFNSTTPIPGALPLFGSVLGGGFLFRKLRKRRQAKAQLAAV